MTISINSQWDDNSVRLTLRIEHPMETGRQVDTTGITIPAWHLLSLSVFVDDAEVAVFDLSPGVAKNPIVSVTLENMEDGQKVRAKWLDNHGHSRERIHTLTLPTE